MKEKSLVTEKQARKLRKGAAKAKVFKQRIKEVLIVALFVGIFIGLFVASTRITNFIKQMTDIQLQVVIFCILTIFCAGIYVKSYDDYKKMIGV